MIILSLIWNSDFDEVAAITVPVIEAYAERHGYQVMRFHNPPCERNVQWERVRIMQEIFESQKPDVCVHIDADVLITNPAIKLEDILPEGDWDIAMSRESDGAWNDGTSMWRRTDSMKGILQEIWDAEAPDATSANGVIQKWYDADSGLMEGGCITLLTPKEVFTLAEIPKRKFNSYRDDWRPGDFVLHLPATSNQTRCEVFRHVQALTGSLKEMLRPWTLSQAGFIRIGHEMDGGYLVPATVLSNHHALYSFGIGEEYSFEQQFCANPSNSAVLFDHTIQFARCERAMLFTNKCTPELVKNIFYEGVIAKMDIEGDEYECLMALRPEALPCCLIVEFHWIDQNQANLRAVLKHLDMLGFRLVHLHGNNHGKYISALGLPETIEVTFVNTAHIAVGEPYFGTLPLAGLDFPNNPDAPDFEIDYTFNGI